MYRISSSKPGPVSDKGKLPDNDDDDGDVMTMSKDFDNRKTY